MGKKRKSSRELLLVDRREHPGQSPGMAPAPITIPGLGACPCCGTEATWPDASKAFVYCAACGLTFGEHTYGHDDVERVYAAWNRRPTDKKTRLEDDKPINPQREIALFCWYIVSWAPSDAI